LEDRAHFVIYN